MIAGHPYLKVALHNSGPLLEWIEENRPEYFGKLKNLVSSGQVEPLGGGFYEPILTMLPEEDRQGQISLMSRYLEERFGKPPVGLWTAERIWEPHLAHIISRSGLSYTLLDDTHFRYAGLPEEEIWGAFITEDQGHSIVVFPTDKHLRYMIPFYKVSENIEYLRGLYEKGVCAVTYGDDGEKFGIWPGTHKLVYTDGWLSRFLKALEENNNWLEMVTFSEYLSENIPRDRIYLPAASYSEMMEWALPAPAQEKLESLTRKLKEMDMWDDAGSYIRGGFFRNFLVKYEESNGMFRKMLYVSSKLSKKNKNKGRSGISSAVRNLYRGQCNCGYWHGIFGGVYLNFLRRAIFEHIIRAERLTERKKGKTRIILKDFLGYGREEIIMETDHLNLYIDPYCGGSLFELDIRNRDFNILDTFTRREEAYHRKIPDNNEEITRNEHASIHESISVKERNLKEHLIFDTYRKTSLIDHIFPMNESLEAFRTNRHHELGNFMNHQYQARLIKGKNPRVVLSGEGTVELGDIKIPLKIRKEIKPDPDSSSLTVCYEFHGFKQMPGKFLFGVEWNLSLQSGQADDCYFLIDGAKPSRPAFGEEGVHERLKKLGIVIGWMNLTAHLTFDRETTLWRVPVETVSLSEGGIERNYQHTTILGLWEINPVIKEPFTITINMVVE